VLVDRTLEVVVLPVSDIDRSLAFYRDQVGFALDHDTRPRAHALKIRGEKPLIPVDHRGRFGA
jgi:catechol 2,3-dioxygenase-like lactoylglutathione lyase family enzyme